MSITRVFFAQPVDSVPPSKIKANVERFQGLTKGMSVEIVAPYLEEEFIHSHIPLDRGLARQLIEKDYAAIDTCDVIFVDLSREDRQAVGMVFEMAYAWSKGKVVIVYTGGSSISHRVWVVAVADCICQSWAEVKDCIKKYTNQEA